MMEHLERIEKVRGVMNRASSPWARRYWAKVLYILYRNTSTK